MNPRAVFVFFSLFSGWVPQASATADGPDFFAVRGVAVNDVLQLRAEPSAKAEKIGEIPHNAWGLRNLGCQGLPDFGKWQQMTERERAAVGRHHWCRIGYRGVEGWVAGRFLQEDGTPFQPPERPSSEQLANATYWGVYDRPVRLVDGTYEGQSFVPGGAARPRVELLSGARGVDNIDGDGAPGAWVLLNMGSGGSGQFLFLAAMTARGGRTDNIGTLRIGDRVDVVAFEVEDGQARLDYVAPGPGEPACCPTQMVSSVYGFEGSELVQLSRTELGALSSERLDGTAWRLVGFGPGQAASEGPSITLRFDRDRIAGSTGCNDWFATVSAATPYRLEVGPVGTTRRMCPPPLMEREQRFLEVLKGATQFGFVLGKLVFTSTEGDTNTDLEFEPLSEE